MTVLRQSYKFARLLHGHLAAAVQNVLFFFYFRAANIVRPVSQSYEHRTAALQPLRPLWICEDTLRICLQSVYDTPGLQNRTNKNRTADVKQA